MKILAISSLVLLFSLASIRASASESATHGKRPLEKSIHMKNFKGTVILKQLSDDKVEVYLRTWRTTRDTVSGHEIFPVLVNGARQSFFFGRFGSSKLPMLIFAVSDPQRISDSHVIAYQVAPNGALIGQQVVVDEAIAHGHTDNVTSGRYQLAAVNPELGAIYSVAYQDAHFEGFFVSYEKMRVRQWDPAINSFIESDQGFLREHSGRLVESTRLSNWPDRKREEVFAENVRSLPKFERHAHSGVKIMPVTA